LHEALGQILAEERRQWRRERALIEAEAQRVTAELRATISELSSEIRQRALQAKPDLSAEALREALGQMFAEERRQWQRERELLQSEAAKTLAEFRAQTVEWHNEFTSIVNTRHRQFADTIDMRQDRKVGPAGPQGPPGKLPPVKKFESGKVYYEGDCVACDSGLHQARCDTGHGVSHPDWICLARAGRDGRDAATPDVRGTYDVHADYKMLDIVACDGAAFIAKRDDPGICQGDGWQLMSQQGRRGKPGQIGERGPHGEKGDKGPTAVVPQFLGAKIDENYNLIRVLSDGTKEIMPLRSAFEQFYREVSE
jgi:hypothetical protein